MPTPLAAERQVLTPSQLNTLARDLLEDAFPLIWVEGELSGVSRPASGHLYFTLKDVRAQVRCALFKPKTQWLKFRPADGVKVLLRARLTVYEARGDYQLIVEHMEEAGEGALLRAFEELKARLAAEGLFDPQRKQAVPRFVRRLGLITSPTGAAVRDVLGILMRRFPLLEVELLPVLVQGDGAPVQIARTVQRADASCRYDALLLTRGGGSLEDLQAFNDEGLARAIAACATPVVCAVGHETDTSIADFVADLRAATPSVAAELLVPDRLALAVLLRRQRARLAQVAGRRLESHTQHLDQLQQRLRAQAPLQRLLRGRERLAAARRELTLQFAHSLRQRRERRLRLGLRLGKRHPSHRLSELHQRLRFASERQRGVTVRLLERRTLQLRELGRSLNAVSPLATLARGYAILRDPDDGRVIASTQGLRERQMVLGRLIDGEIELRIERISPDRD
jgi:exodeoxyribonuclease VII large subunit